jgi:hypothetical protein
VSELENKRWAVLNDRGVAVKNATYIFALKYARLFKNHPTVVTDEAARRDAESREKQLADK